MVDASVPVARVRAHSLPAANGAVLPQTLRLDPPISQPLLWRLVLVGLGPLGAMSAIAAVVAIRQWLGM